MLAKLDSACLAGMEGVRVHVEVSLAKGSPCFTITQAGSAKRHASEILQQKHGGPTRSERASRGMTSLVRSVRRVARILV